MADVLNGTSLLLYRETGEVGSETYKAVGHATSHTMTVTMATRDTSTKDSGDYTSREGGRLDVSGSADGLTVYEDDFNFEDMQDIITSREIVVMVFAKSEDEDANTSPDLTEPYARGSFYITSYEQSAPDQENATYSISYEGIGDFELLPT